MIHRISWLSGIVLLSLGVALASTTQIWKQDTAEEFEHGMPTSISIRSDGYLQLSPQLDKIFETTDAFFWTAAEDSKGRLFIGSGNEGKVYAYSNGQGRLFFDAPEMEVHALAVDSQDNLYVGTSPDGKIYRLTPDGTSQVFYDPKAKYIWALALDGRGNLYAGTGGEGKIFRVDSQGRGEVFFDSEEKHIRSLAVDAQGNLIAGSEGKARIFRLTPAGRAFTLYDAPVREITSMVIAKDGLIYAAGIGQREEKLSTPTSRSAASVPTFSSVITVLAADAVQAVSPESGRDLRVAGSANKEEVSGSVIYRIPPDGFPQEMWKSEKTTIYSLVVQPDGSLLAGTGDKGIIYRIEADGLHSLMLNRTQPSQVTALVRSAHQPLIYAITSNLAHVYALKPSFAREGSFISSVRDTGTFSQWGRASVKRQVPPGASVRLFTRSGNTLDPDNTWSEWTEVVNHADGQGQLIPSPQARFIQWKLILSSADGAQTPDVNSVELAYLPRNAPPQIESVTLQPPDIAFENVPTYGTIQPLTVAGASAGGSSSSQAQTNRKRHLQPASGQIPPRQLIKQGYRTVTWQATDANDDDLIFSVYIRGEGETVWKLLKDNIDDSFYSWDTTELPDGNYSFRLVASDERSNPPDKALVTERVTEWFEVDNTPPRIEGLNAAPEAGRSVRVRFAAHDSATPISEAEYLVDNLNPKMVLSTDGILDSEDESFDFVIKGMKPGEHTITVRVKDGADNLASAKVVVKVE